MKICSLCGSTYEARVEFCFKDGNPLKADPAAVGAGQAAPEADALAPSALVEPRVGSGADSAARPDVAPSPEDAPDPVSYTHSDAADEG